MELKHGCSPIRIAIQNVGFPLAEAASLRTRRGDVEAAGRLEDRGLAYKSREGLKSGRGAKCTSSSQSRNFTLCCCRVVRV